MAEIQPPHYLQEGCHTAQGDRQILSSLVCGEGVAYGASAGNNLEVIDGPSGMQVTVQSGNAFIQGDDAAWQGMYHVTNDGNVNITLAAADPTNPRIDLIVAVVHDNTYSVPGDDWQLEAVTGTPAGSPSPPATPDSAIVLARVAVAGGAVAITSGDITDAREPYSLCAASLMETVVFTSSGSFTKADYPGLQFVRVYAQGGGGLGGGAQETVGSQWCLGSGGGAGACGVGVVAAASLASTETVTVGAGLAGAGGVGGGTAGASSFGAFVSGSGGKGGLVGTPGTTPGSVAGADPQTGGTGDYVIPGGPGQVAYRATAEEGSFSGAGGDSNLGRGGRARASAAAGIDGTGYGGGGGGGFAGASSGADIAGGDGTDGVVIVEVYG